MAEEIKDELKDEEQNTDYIEAIKKLKANSVDKDKYDAKVKENQELIQALVDGKQLEIDNASEQVKPDIPKLRQELFGSDDLTNLEYISKALELRKAVMDEDGTDIFLPYGQNISPTPQDVEAANETAEAFQHCIDYANGDPSLFTSELQRITVDNMPVMNRRRK